MEPATIKHLADAAAALQAAQKATRQGFVEDHCNNALREIEHALRMASQFIPDEEAE